MEYELTGEEAINATLKMQADSCGQATVQDCLIAVAKAQRKKLVVWLGKKGYVAEMDDGERIVLEFRLEGADWQALLKEHEVE